MYATEAACCAPGTAFPDGCAPPAPPSAQPCWVVDTYFPARLCRESRTLCGAKGESIGLDWIGFVHGFRGTPDWSGVEWSGVE